MMAISTIVAWLSWSLIVLNVNPEETGLWGFVLFYFTLITGLIGTLSLIGILYRVMLRQRKEVLSREVKISFRHAVLLSFVAVSALALSAYGILHWWILLVLIVIVSAVEYVFLMVQQARRG
jgi:hypothetical protein